MFSRLSPAVRNIVALAIIIAVPFLFIIALYIGNKEQAPDMGEDMGEEVATAEEVAEESPPDTQVYESAEDAVEDAEPIELPSEGDKENAEELARQFIAEFHQVDSGNPLDYLEKSKEYMTESLYNEYAGIPKRGTLAAQKAVAVDMETRPVELEENRQVWGVYVTSEETAADGSMEYVFNAYSVLLIKDGNGWLVDGVRADEY